MNNGVNYRLIGLLISYGYLRAWMTHERDRDFDLLFFCFFLIIFDSIGRWLGRLRYTARAQSFSFAVRGVSGPRKIGPKKTR